MSRTTPRLNLGQARDARARHDIDTLQAIHEDVRGLRDEVRLLRRWFAWGVAAAILAVTAAMIVFALWQGVWFERMTQDSGSTSLDAPLRSPQSSLPESVTRCLG